MKIAATGGATAAPGRAARDPRGRSRGGRLRQCETRQVGPPSALVNSESSSSTTRCPTRRSAATAAGGRRQKPVRRAAARRRPRRRRRPARCARSARAGRLGPAGLERRETAGDADHAGRSADGDPGRQVQTTVRPDTGRAVAHGAHEPGKLLGGLPVGARRQADRDAVAVDDHIAAVERPGERRSRRPAGGTEQRPGRAEHRGDLGPPARRTGVSWRPPAPPVRPGRRPWAA